MSSPEITDYRPMRELVNVDAFLGERRMNRRLFVGAGIAIVALMGKPAAAAQSTSDLIRILDDPQRNVGAQIEFVGKVVSIDKQDRSRQSLIRLLISASAETGIMRLYQVDVVAGSYPINVEPDGIVLVSGTIISTTTRTALYGQPVAPVIDATSVVEASDEAANASSQVVPAEHEQVVSADGWSMRTLDAFNHTPKAYDGGINILCQYGITNTEVDPRTFSDNDTSYRLISRDGWYGEFNRDLTEVAQKELSQWTGDQVPDVEYEHWAVFSVPIWDPHRFPEEPQNWVLQISRGSYAYLMSLWF